MKLRTVQELLGAEILCEPELLENEIDAAFAADLMSDVLAFVDERCLLLTGLVNQHVIHTAEIADITGIVFVRGKMPGLEILYMAKERGIGVLRTKKTLYETCGILYSNGLSEIKGR
ncbi:MAG: DRTGG domain-containing protein [Christensenellales bacterium]